MGFPSQLVTVVTKQKKPPKVCQLSQFSSLVCCEPWWKEEATVEVDPIMEITVRVTSFSILYVEDNQ